MRSRKTVFTNNFFCCRLRLRLEKFLRCSFLGIYYLIFSAAGANYCQEMEINWSLWDVSGNYRKLYLFVAWLLDVECFVLLKIVCLGRKLERLIWCWLRGLGAFFQIVSGTGMQLDKWIVVQTVKLADRWTKRLNFEKIS